MVSKAHINMVNKQKHTLQILSHMLRIHKTSNRKVWSNKRDNKRHKKNTQMQPILKRRVRPTKIKEKINV